MVTVGGLAGAGVRVLLVGTGSHRPGSRLADLPVVEPTVRALEACLVERCGADTDRLRVLVDPENPLVLANELHEVARAAEDVLLIWYIGHGLVDANNELYLATRAASDLTEGRAVWQALPYEEIRAAVRNCRARSVVVVLDCCFAGRAVVPAAGGFDDAFSAVATRGAYLLTSATRDERALAPDGEPYTAFTGEALHLLTRGDPARGPAIHLDDLYEHLLRTLPARGCPRPRRWAVDGIGSLVLAANPAFTPREPSRHPMTDLELRGAVEGPAHNAGLVWEDGLVDLIMRDLAARRSPHANLPLLSHLLRAAWHASDRRTLTFADYHQAGAIDGAIVSTAENSYAKLPPDAQDAARRALLRMVRVPSDGEATRRRMHRDHLPHNPTTRRH